VWVAKPTLKVELPDGEDLADDTPTQVVQIRRWARGTDAAMDQSVGIMADLLDDMDYLGKDPDIPASERKIFNQVWPEARPEFVSVIRQILSSSRNVARSLDDWADYLVFSAVARNTEGKREVSTDPQLEEMLKRALNAIRKLESLTERLGGVPPPQNSRSE
jgi:hypothetical protein